MKNIRPIEVRKLQQELMPVFIACSSIIQQHNLHTMRQRLHLSMDLGLMMLMIFLMMPCALSQCSTCVQLSAFGCNVCYNSCSTRNQLLLCNYTYCSDYSTDQNGTSTCNAYEWKNLAESECFHQCCESSQTQFSVDELKRCETKSKQRITIAIAVSCSIVGVILIIIIACCGGFNKLGSCCKSLLESISDCCRFLADCLGYICTCRCLRTHNGQNAVNKTQVVEISKAQLHVKWEEDLKNNKKLEDEGDVCSVCLSNRSDTQGACGHCFHIDCISEWFNRNPHCPVCRSEQVRWVKFYCRGCCLRYIKFDLSVDKRINQSINEAKGPNCRSCQ